MCDASCAYPVQVANAELRSLPRPIEQPEKEQGNQHTVSQLNLREPWARSHMTLRSFHLRRWATLIAETKWHLAWNTDNKTLPTVRISRDIPPGRPHGVLGQKGHRRIGTASRSLVVEEKVVLLVGRVLAAAPNSSASRR